MQVAEVIGHTTSTIKHASLRGWKLAVVQPLDVDGNDDGAPVIAIDELGASLHDRVMITSDGSSVREIMRSKTSPVRWAVIGIEDQR